MDLRIAALIWFLLGVVSVLAIKSIIFAPWVALFYVPILATAFGVLTLAEIRHARQLRKRLEKALEQNAKYQSSCNDQR